MTSITAGQLFFCTTGEHSDYSVNGHFRALQDFSMDVEIKRYLSEHPDQRLYYKFQEAEFIEFLKTEKIIEEIQIINVHLGNYGCVPKHFLLGE